MDVTLTVDTTRELGTRPSRRLRAAGKVPAVVYGRGTDPRSVTVEWPALRKAITTDAGLNALITLEVEGEPYLTIIKDLQRHPVKRNVVHVDFQIIDRDVAISVDVPVILVGIPREVELKKGMVDQLRHNLTIQAKPGFIPTQLDVDITDLDIGTNVTVGDIVFPEGVATEVELDEIVAQGSAMRIAELEEVVEGEGEGEGEEGEGVEGEGGESEAEGGDS
jgi:large subunit ribosomal protein L25